MIIFYNNNKSITCYSTKSGDRLLDCLDIGSIFKYILKASTEKSNFLFISYSFLLL